jgi:hypothetical protein
VPAAPEVSVAGVVMAALGGGTVDTVIAFDGELTQLFCVTMTS